ncbi:MAG: SDR family NAD(P)-dependent oxidoreductase [Sphingobium sp.]
MARFSGKVALVTGGGSGLGEACCRLFAQQGACVIVAERDELRARVAAGRVSDAWVIDVGSDSDWADTARMIEARFGRLDILVNNAGFLLVADLEATSLEDFRRVNNVMAEGVFLGCKHMLPLLRKSASGAIVIMASTASHLGYHQYLAYCAAKGAVRSMTRAIAVECHVKGYPVRCNSVHPGGIETSLQREAEDRECAAQIKATGVLPFGSNGLPQDVANLVAFLASDEARFITGAEYVIDNGATVWPVLR